MSVRTETDTVNLPRWLQHRIFLSELNRLDQKYLDEQRTGPLVLEIHYHSGRPLVAKVRDVLMAPILVEVGLLISSTS